MALHRLQCVVGVRCWHYSAWSECVVGITVRGRSALLALQCVVGVRCRHYSAWSECVAGITVRGRSALLALQCVGRVGFLFVCFVCSSFCAHAGNTHRVFHFSKLLASVSLLSFFIIWFSSSSCVCVCVFCARALHNTKTVFITLYRQCVCIH